MTGIMRKAVLVSVLWVLAKLAFPGLATHLPPTLVLMTDAVAGALIITGREHVAAFFMILAEMLLSPLHAVYKSLEKLLDIIADMLGW